MHIMNGMKMMIKIVLILSTILTFGSLYATYSGIGVQEVVSTKEPKKSIRSHSTSHRSSSGWSYGK